MNLLEGRDTTHTLEKVCACVCVFMCACARKCTYTKLLELTGWQIGHRHSKGLKKARS